MVAEGERTFVKKVITVLWEVFAELFLKLLQKHFRGNRSHRWGVAGEFLDRRAIGVGSRVRSHSRDGISNA